MKHLKSTHMCKRAFSKEKGMPRSPFPKEIDPGKARRANADEALQVRTGR